MDINSQVAAIANKLEQLTPKMERQGCSKALRKGAKLYASELKPMTPFKTGTILESEKVRAGKRKEKGVVSIITGLGRNFFKSDKWYAAFEIFGHKVGGKRKSATPQLKSQDDRKQVPPNEFMLKAFEATKQQALETIIDQLQIEIDKAIE